MNQQLINVSRYDNPNVGKKEKELDLISTERV